MPEWLRSAVGWVARESAGVLAKETLKILVLTIVALLGAWFLAAIGHLFRLPIPLTATDLSSKVAFLAGEFWAHPYEYTVGLTVKDPVHSISALVLIAGYLVAFVLVRRAHRRIKSQAANLQEAAVARALVSQLGVGGRWPHTAADAAGAPWPEIRQEILRPENNVLDILGANGIDTFGGADSPLYDVLQIFRGTVRVILLHPTSAQMAGRAQAVGMNVRSYRKAIIASQTRLRNLRNQHHAVEGRFYDGQPNWKFIITSRTVWAQYYMPGGQHVKDTPMYRFDATNNGHLGFYHIFHMEFDRVWRRCETFPMKLE